MTKAHPRSGAAGTGAVTAGSGQATLARAGVVAAAGALTLLGRAGAAISSPPAGPADLAAGRGRDAPVPPPGATGPAANSTREPR
jgi:hypothetical protein